MGGAWTMSTQQEVDEAVSTLQQALQALRDFGFITEEDEDE
jgi:hypothetical protein